MVVFISISTYHFIVSLASTVFLLYCLGITTSVLDTKSTKKSHTKHGVGIQEYVGTMNDEEQSGLLGLSVCGQEYFFGNQMNESLILHSVVQLGRLAICIPF